MISPLQDRLTVETLDDGFVAITVTLPVELVQDYRHFLESLSRFFHAVQVKGKISHAQSRAESQALDREAENNLAAYRARIVRTFDRYTSRGLDRKAAIQAIAQELRVEDHPWRSPDLIRSTLVAAGRGGRPGRPRRGQP